MFDQSQSQKGKLIYKLEASFSVNLSDFHFEFAAKKYL